MILFTFNIPLTTNKYSSCDNYKSLIKRLSNWNTKIFLCFSANSNEEVKFLLTRRERTSETERKRESFWPKSWVTGGNKIRLRIPSNCRIFDSNIFQLLGIPSRILVPLVIQFSGQNDSIFFQQTSWEYPCGIVPTNKNVHKKYWLEIFDARSVLK